MAKQSRSKYYIVALLSCAVILAAIGTWFYARPASATKSVKGKTKSLPYWQRTGFLSKILQDLHAEGAKGIDSIELPEGFEIAPAVKPGLVTYPMFISFDDRGRLFVCESAGKNIGDEDMGKQPEMRIRMLQDTDGDGVFDSSTIFADHLTMAMGAQWYRGSLYVAAPPDVWRFTDTDNDGVAERRELLLTGWPLHSNGTTLHGPFLGPDGWMYLTYNYGAYKIQTKEGTTLTGPGGRVFRFRPDGTGLESIIGGRYDNGIEMVFTPAGEMMGTMTYYRNPKMGERDALLHYVEGGVYPKRTAAADKDKRTGDLMPAMTKFARVAPAGLLLYRGNGLGPEYRGNLFSAHFNPHRILRHVVERSGGTFRTKDEDFLVSKDPDFHPTDVTQAGDGSLLVVETGAWYLHSCPVSRIAKPEFKGMIYRVRRKNVPKVDDAWGLGLSLPGKTPAELATFLADDRPAVRDQAQDLLVQAGDSAVDSLIRVRETQASPEIRASAVFALARIGTPKAAAAVRAALGDNDFLPRVAAARMAGMAKDREAVPRLMEMVKRDHPAVRRQAATALGQIGDPRAVPALIAASQDPEDRFVEHSVIYSLITLKTPEPVNVALKSPHPKIRKAALIALDQMDGSPLQRDQLVANLNASDAQLRKGALWVASHHPDWSADVLNVLRARLSGGQLPSDDADGLQETLASLCRHADTQKLIAKVLADPSAKPLQRAFLMNTIESCPVTEFPAAWTDTLRQQLRGRDPDGRARAVAVLRARQLTGLDEELGRLAANASEPNNLRMLALGVLVPRMTSLPAESFSFLTSLLRSDVQANIRQSAAQVLGRGKLSDQQLERIARDQLPKADPLILPHLLECFRPSHSAQTGRMMVEGLIQSKYSGEGIAAQRIPELLQNFPQEVKSAAKPLLDRIQSEKDLRAGRLKTLEPLLKGGDIDRGREVFFGAKAGCSSCHTIMADGGDVGPDLTGVGAVRSGLDLLEAIVYPSASFVPGHEVYRVETDREVYTGVQGESSSDTLLIISGPEDRVRIPRKEIRSIRPSPVSLMPDGYAEDLSQQELRDLLAFLQAQKSRTS